MNLKHLQFLLTFSLLSFFIGCNESDEPKPDPIASVVIINEGNFSAANGSFDLFNQEKNEYTSGVFQSVNNFPVGSTIQNAIVSNDFIISTTNAVDKVEFIDKTTFSSIKSVVDGMKTPFGIAANDEYAFITNWGTFNNETFIYDDPSIITINLATFQIASTLGLNVQPQHALFINDHLYVSDIGNFSVPGGSVSVYEISGGIPQLEKLIVVQPGPDKMVVDENSNLWVICTSGALVQINTEINEVVKTIQNVPVLGFNEKLTINSTGTNLYWLASSGFPDYNSAVYTVSTTNPTLGEPIIEGTNFHGLGIDGNNMYIGDHAAYQSAGKVLRYADFDTTPRLLETLPSGLAPNGFIFR